MLYVLVELNVDFKANNPITRTARRDAAPTATPNNIFSSFTLLDGEDSLL